MRNTTVGEAREDCMIVHPLFKPKKHDILTHGSRLSWGDVAVGSVGNMASPLTAEIGIPSVITTKRLTPGGKVVDNTLYIFLPGTLGDNFCWYLPIYSFNLCPSSIGAQCQLLCWCEFLRWRSPTSTLGLFLCGYNYSYKFWKLLWWSNWHFMINYLPLWKIFLYFIFTCCYICSCPQDCFCWDAIVKDWYVGQGLPGQGVDTQLTQ